MNLKSQSMITQEVLNKFKNLLNNKDPQKILSLQKPTRERKPNNKLKRD